MPDVDKLFVSIHFGGEEMEVGELVRNNARIYFRYNAEFIRFGLQISPFKLPLNEKIMRAEVDFFEGLHGVFFDSLPDGWGRLLLDRILAAKGILPEQINPLDRLSYVGRTGMGALIYRPEIWHGKDAPGISGLDEIAGQVKQAIEGKGAVALDDLFRLGGSSGGARPKILVGYNPETDHFIRDEETLPEGYEHWIVKFPASVDRPDIANIEYAYYLMAVCAGIHMSESRLFTGKSGRAYFGTKRFDRKGAERLHMHSASGLMHDNYSLSSMDYGHLMDAAFTLERHVAAYDKILRLAAFNVFAHNRDDHSKNFAFLMDAKGRWTFAPAFDLTFSYSSHGHHSTMVDGESKNPGATQLLSLGEQFGIKNPDHILDEVREVIINWQNYAKDAGVSKVSRDLIARVIG